MGLSICFKAFLIALTTIVRSQLRQMLNSVKLMIQAKLVVISSLVARNSIGETYYKTLKDQVDKILEPLEKAMLVVPLGDLKGCTEGTIFFGNIQKRYYDYKHQLEDISFTAAQYTFTITYYKKLESELLAQIDKIEQIIDFLEQVAIGGIAPGSHVRIYYENGIQVNKKGVVSSIVGTTVNGTYDVEYGGGAFSVPSTDCGGIS